MRVGLALLLKEVQQHLPALVGVCALTAALTVVTWVIGLQERWVTLLAAAHTVVLVGAPFAGLYVAERLVVQDHQAGTHEFLAALPIAPGLRAAVRLALGLAVTEALVAAVLVATTALAGRREGVPAGFVLAVWAQLGAYAGTWFAVAFGLAHLGRYRWLAWWLLGLGSSVAAAFVHDSAARLFWVGLVVDGPDRTRLDPPWEAMPITLAWGLAGAALGFAVSTWRGGWLLERWFRPTTAHERARLIGLGVAALMATSVLDLSPTEDPWATLPAVDARRAVVRVAASRGSPLWAVAERAAAALDDLGDALDVDAWPPVVVLRSRPEPGVPAVHPAPAEDGGIARVLLVDPDRPAEDLVGAIVSQAAAHRLAGLADRDGRARWLVDGLGPWWVGPEGARRRAIGVPASGDDWLRVRGDLGPDGAAAAARAGLDALADLGGRDAVLAVARAVLRPRWSTTWPSAVRLHFVTRGAWVERLTGVDEDAWRAAWAARLASQRRPASGFPALSVAARDGETLVVWADEPPPSSVVEWSELDALQAWPLPDDPSERVVPEGAAREVALRVDLRRRVAARWVRTDPDGGVVASPWTVGP